MLRKLLPPGLASIMFSADGGQGHHQVPFGGTKARLGSNPIALSFPYQEGAPFLADFATSAVAAGKVLVCHARGQKLKEGWMVDAEGKPTTNPQRITSRAGRSCRLEARRVIKATHSLYDSDF